MMLCLKLTLLTLLIVAPGLLVSGETVITCDGKVQTLSCGTKLIRVLSTVYGRTNRNTCRPPHGTVDNTNCKSNITSIADRCNGLKVCEVNTRFLDTVDPCKRTNKYYNTTYECISGKNVAVCENDSDKLDCESDTIDIINANFGSDDSTTCKRENHHNMKMKTNCYAKGVHSTVESQCEGRKSCSVQASSCYNFNHHCKDGSKFLSVSYRCLRTLITCESQTASLNCGDLKIEIISADYGRTDKTTCDGGRPDNQLSNTNCHSTTALDKVKTSCNGKSTCSMAATNAVFTDPCTGTYKYLTIVYTCA